MSTINKKIGEINLRDFKTLFDRPGFYRFHFKTVDQEFGMVKEEVNVCENIPKKSIVGSNMINPKRIISL